MAATAAMIGAIGTVGGSVWSGVNQSHVNNQNFNAQQQHQAMMQQLIGGQMHQGQNPYAAGYLQQLASLGGQQIPQGAGTLGPPKPNGLGGGNAYADFGMAGPGMGTGNIYPEGAPGAAGIAGVGGPQSNLWASGDAPDNNPAGSGNGNAGGVAGSGGGNGGPGDAGGYQGGGPGGNGWGQPQAPINMPNPYNPLNSWLNSPFTYNPSQQGQINPYQAQQVGGLGQLGAPGQVQAQQVGGPAGFQLPTIQAPAAVNTQGFNPGQDALMQMLQKDINPPGNTQLDSNLNRLASGTDQYDNSSMFKALQSQDAFNTQQQVDQLHSGATDLGKRFGTAMNQNEALLRSQIQNGVNMRNAQIGQQSFESAMNRSVQATGQQANYQTGLNQNAFQNAGLQQQAAGTAGGLFNQMQGLNLQAQTTNAGNAMQAQQANLSALLQASLQQQSLGQQAQVANQGANLQAGQFNTNAGMQAGQFNINTALAQAQANQQASMQAALAGQGVNAQIGSNNQNAMNAAGQFNANAGMQQSAFNAQQGSAFNQLLAQLSGQAQGAQQWQDQNNAGLIGLLNGVQMPMQQPSAIPGGIVGGGNNLLTSILLGQYMNQGHPGQYGQSTYGSGGMFGWH